MKQKTKFKQTEIGMIPKDWEIKKLGEVAGFQYGLGESAEKEGDYVYLRITDISSDNTLNKSGLRYVKKEKVSPKYILKKGDVLVARTGATYGKTLFFHKDFKATFGGFLIKLIFDDKLIDNRFFFQFSRSKIYWHQANNLVSGGAQPQFNANTLSELIVPLPPIQEQRAISKILSDLDAKIELLQKQNEVLEKIGQAIFKHWFVDFEFPNEEGKPYKSSGGEMVYNEELGKEIPKRWNVGKLSDLVENIKESLKPGKDLIGRKYVPINEIPMKKFGLYSFKPIEEAKSSLIGFERGDILFGAMRAYFHRVNFSHFKGVTRTTTMVLRPKKEIYFSYALFLLNLPDSVEYANMHSKGSTIPYAVWENSLGNLPCLIHESTIKLFNYLVIPLLNRLSYNVDQIQILQQIRDSLLPKLMTGKIRVPLE